MKPLPSSVFPSNNLFLPFALCGMQLIRSARAPGDLWNPRRMKGVLGVETEGVTVTVHEQDMSGEGEAIRTEASTTTTGKIFIFY